MGSEPFFDVEPERTPLKHVVALTTTHMSRSKLLRYTAELRNECGLPKEVALEFGGLYAGRRVQPTLADIERYGDSERLDIGGWYSKSVSASTAIPNRYSSARQYTVASLKHNLIQKAAVAFQHWCRTNHKLTNPDLGRLDWLLAKRGAPP
jgi:hypothetical protein